jgi:soluble lytic murein transglycosylase-like protein
MRALGASNPSTAQIQAMITAAATSAGIDPAIALAVAQTESGFNPNAVNTANTNGTTDYGVFQINSSNLASLGLTSNPLDPQANINAGVGLLAQLLNQYNGDVQSALWAYNAGPGAVANGNLPASTANYISTVTNAITQFGGALPSSTDTDASSSDTVATFLSSIDTGTISLLGYDVPTPYAIGGVLALFGLIWAMSD